jgi:hypothetical protein
MIDAQQNDDEIHIFHRIHHYVDFTYLGRGVVLSVERRIGEPSKFQFRVE